METLGSLCDKLTVVVLKRWHSTDREQLNSLEKQQTQLQEEMAAFVASAVSGAIPPERVTFVANKVVHAGMPALEAACAQTIGEAVSQLAALNCELWHEVEKSYDDSMVLSERAELPKSIATLNLQRNRYIDLIDALLARALGRK